MNESVEDIGVDENVFATLVSNTYAIGEVMNQADRDTSVNNENIDDDIMQMSVPSTEAALEKVDITAKDITMTENLVAITGTSAKEIEEILDPIAEVKIENREATFIPNTEGIPEIVDQKPECINAIGDFLATPGPSVEGVNEAMYQTVEDFKVVENLNAAPISCTEVFTEVMNLDEVSDTESFVTATGSTPERMNEIMYEATEDMNVIENVLTVFIPNTEGISEIVVQEPECINAIGDFLATPGPSVERVNAAMYQTVEDLKVAENLKVAPVSCTAVFTEAMNLDVVSDTESFVTSSGSSTKRINEIMYEATEDMNVIENFLTTLESNTHVIRGIRNQAIRGTSVNNQNTDDGIMQITSVPSTETVLEKVDITAQDITLTENLVATPGPSAKVNKEIVDQTAEVKIENREASFQPNTEGISEVMDQEAAGIDEIGNLVVIPGPSVEDVSEEMDQIVEDFKVTESLKATPVSGTEVFTEVIDPDGVSATESLVATPESITEGINEILDETTEDISVMENIEVICLPNTGRLAEINDKIAQSFSLTENLEAIPMSNTGINETHVQNENTTNIIFDKEMINTENDTENKTSKIMESEAKSQKNVSERKIKSLKRKRAPPLISEMLMDSIKSLKRSSGVSFEDIKTHMENNYPVKVKALVKYHVVNFLKKWVEMGILEKVDGADMGERFIIKESKIGFENDCIIQAKKLKLH